MFVKDINCGLITFDSGVKLLSAENLPKVIDVTVHLVRACFQDMKFWIF